MERYLIIGTAGHVDHGKTHLIQTLTGISTDRLKEEKERGISIELGFAYLTLPDGRKAGIIDVPGHEKFVRQMLAGASGMDIVLLIIAADEGVMPQTQEHLDILNMLNVEKGIVVFTKIDLVDQEWLSMIELDTREKLQDSFLRDAPYCKVSSVTGQGISELLQTIMTVLQTTEGKRSDLPSRMPIDRVFTIRGFGTVVTGTLNTGTIQKGQEVCLEPGGQAVKIRNIQVHGEQVSEAYAGQRVAINIAGLAVSDIPKGASLVDPGYYNAGQILDVELFNLASEQRTIKQRQRIHFHLGTAETLGRVHLLAQEELVPGEKGFAQIILEEPVVAAKGDRFVIRYYSPVATIGGGVVLSLAAAKQKRFREKVITEFQSKAEGGLTDQIKKELTIPLSSDEVRKKSALGQEEVQLALDHLKDDQTVVILSEDGLSLFWLKSTAEEWALKVNAAAMKYQKTYPLRGGIGREELKKILKTAVSHKRWQLILEWGADHQYFRLSSSLVQAASEIELPEDIRQKLDALQKIWEKTGLNPPGQETAVVECGVPAAKFSEYAEYLKTNNIWKQIGEFYIAASAIEKAKIILEKHLQENGQITVSEARDCWQTSRKFAVPLLEYFDSTHVTERNGDIRIKPGFTQNPG
ncbi:MULTISPECIES: selenocysteine-specific translation elongation factor [unclassified Dehalobacter]|uniref:selenocysteine-specific translation elongation factor n=1 Tax=unclassified Dehalobacter TaxID=2635733 RepID=UPI000E6CFDD8|nr:MULTISPECIES: selenocysteine-specific translation elongation factor [unclassified Dehalobacter]RJE47366.1 selenocysteine-specific translation elongation factor [Dehalobacter sp. MCB1]TCX48825.1 selenocysteine-specific translation elongation factor [Dehalobacter sp. 14DCB1]TCX56127.1 selenocysteine-specific translation elongation factor [Dehalobacter sp. 12DCB1]